MPDQYTLELRFERMRAEVLLNDIPIGVGGPGSASPIVFPVSEFVTGGENRLELIARPGIPGSRARSAAAGPMAVAGSATDEEVGAATARLLLLPEGQRPGFDPGIEVARLAWSGPIAGAPEVRQVEVRLPGARPQWTWQRATPLALADPGVRARVLGSLKELHELLRLQRVDAFVAALERKVVDGSLAYGVAPEVLQAEVRRAIEEHLQPPFQLAPFRPEAVDLRAAAGGRLVVCTEGDREPPLRFVHDARPGDELAFPLMLGSLGGRLEVLR